MDFSKIETIIFDLGGVIIDLDEQKTRDQIQELVDPQKPLFDYKIFSDFEVNAISSGRFVTTIKGSCRDDVTEAQIIDAWNAMLVSIPGKRLELMNSLRDRYKVLVLSNTNQIHAERFDEILMEEMGQPDLGLYADRVYYSQDLKLRKPDVAIYEFIARDFGFDPTKALFLDDKPENLSGARHIGIQTARVEFPDMIFDILKEA